MFLKTLTILCCISFCKTDNSKGDSQHISIRTNCTPAAIYEFPNDGFTREQRRSGWITIHVALAIYCFVALSIVCDDFFVPAIQYLVADLRLSEDVAGASFMAITSSSPELFINIVSTFITEGDLGVGTVVGSNVFNVLAAPSICGLFAKTVFKFEAWSIMRDGLTYAIAVLMLIAVLYDDRVYWYEAMSFVLVYVAYLAIIYFSKPIEKTVYACNGKRFEAIAAHRDQQSKTLDGDAQDKRKKIYEIEYWKVVFCPMRYTIPIGEKVYLLTLAMCMVWIGSISYITAWLITAIGDTINIPDSVMGLSFLAVGSSMPEIITCIIVSRTGQGLLGMSSALGANTFEILLCLGLPWLIKTCFNAQATGKSWIKINSSGLSYNATCLLSTLVFLYICLISNKFRLDKKTGVMCLTMYVVFLFVGSLIELNVFFPVNLPTCL